MASEKCRMRPNLRAPFRRRHFSSTNGAAPRVARPQCKPMHAGHADVADRPAHQPQILSEPAGQTPHRPANHPTCLLPLLVMPHAARRTLFRSGTLPACPWRASAPASRGQKAPGNHHPHHQNGQQYQNLPHGERLLAYGCRSAGVMPAISGASKSLRLPLPDGNSLRTSWHTHAIPTCHKHKRPTLASEPLR